MNYMAGRTILDGYGHSFYAENAAAEIARRPHGKSANNSLGDTERAFANLTIFSKATFRSPRSTPPM
jgi:hypothetical protein